VKFLERGVRSSPNVALNSTKYFDRWSHLLTNSSFKGYYRYIARKYEPKFAKCGYSLTKIRVNEEALYGRAHLSDAIGAFYCHARMLVPLCGAFRLASTTT
jgi:hypothetical protein